VVINKTVMRIADAESLSRISGTPEALFENRDHFRALAKRLTEHGVNLSEDERWGGWLGGITKSSVKRYTTSAIRRKGRESGA